jgi:hypothetical protein
MKQVLAVQFLNFAPLCIVALKNKKGVIKNKVIDYEEAKKYVPEDALEYYMKNKGGKVNDT